MCENEFEESIHKAEGPRMNTNVLAIDLAKSVFQMHGLHVGDKAELTYPTQKNRDHLIK